MKKFVIFWLDWHWGPSIVLGALAWLLASKPLLQTTGLDLDVALVVAVAVTFVVDAVLVCVKKSLVRTGFMEN